MNEVVAELSYALRMQQQGKRDLAEKILYKYKDTVEAESEILEAASLARRLGEISLAIQLYSKIADRAATNRTHLAFHSLGNLYRELERLPEAIECYKRALKINPRYIATYMRLGNAVRTSISNEQGIDIYREGLRLCNDASLRSRLLLALHYTDRYSPEEVADEHRIWGRLHAPAVEYTNSNHDLSPSRRLKLGYVSGDLRLHSVSYFLLPLLRSRSRGRFQVYCYSTGDNADATTNIIRNLCDEFREIFGLSDTAALEIIRNDEIDILVDLSGHTPRNRLSLFAGKPAPLQISYMGYPDTTGVGSMDYRIVDHLTDPMPQAAKLNTEKPLYMPECFLCFTSPDTEKLVANSHPPCADSRFVTFGSFNDFVKINDEVLACWCRILQRVPRSKLVLKTKEFGKREVVERIKKQMGQAGISQERLIFYGRIASRAEHLKLYDEVDIALDTFPYNGTTTTFQALGMGVPVVAFRGDRHVARVSYSILTNIGCSELVGLDLCDYENIAVNLAVNPKKINWYKRELRPRLNRTVSDEKRFMRGYEAALLACWADKCRRLMHERGLASLRIGCVGDVMLARRMHYYYEQEGANKILGAASEKLKQNDFNICNFEGVVTDTANFYPKGESKPYYLKSTRHLSHILRDAPFRVAVHGNNHAMDAGPEGIKSHHDILNSLGVLTCGSGRDLADACKPAYIYVRGLWIAVIGFSSTHPKTNGATDQQAGIFLISDPKKIAAIVCPIIHTAKSHAHFVIVSPHWNENWETEPKSVIKEQARLLIESGCDAIIGHSSHLLHGIEIYRGKPIIYDMGTFIVDSVYGHNELKYTGLFNLIVERDRGVVGLEVNPFELKNGEIVQASRESNEWIKKRLLSLGEREVVALQQDKQMVFRFNLSGTEVNRPASEPPTIHATKPIANVSYDEPSSLLSLVPWWCSANEEVVLGGKVAFLGLRTPRAVWTKAGFLSEAVFRCDEYLEGNYEIHIQGRCSVYGSEFNEFHPCSHGAYNPQRWKKGEVILDSTCIRPPRGLTPGKYQLYIGIKNVTNRTYLTDPDGNRVTKVEGSWIYVLPREVSHLASGIEWDGTLDSSLEKKFLTEFYCAPEATIITWIKRQLQKKTERFPIFAVEGLVCKYRLVRKQPMLFISICQGGKEPLRWGSSRSDLAGTISRNINQITSHRRFGEFNIHHKQCFEIICEIVVMEMRLADILAGEKMPDSLSGLKHTSDGRLSFLLPSECAAMNLLTIERQLAVLVKERLHISGDPSAWIQENMEQIRVIETCQFRG